MGNNPLNILAQVPADEEAENSVIGAILFDKNALSKISDNINPDDFYSRINQEAYAIMLSLEEKGCPIDIITVNNELKKKKIDGVGHLTDCMSNVVSTSSIKEHAKIIKEKRVLRELLATSNDLIEQARGGEVDPDDLVDMVEQRIFSISKRNGRKKYRKVSDLTDDAIDKFNKIISGEIEPGIMTGLKNLDNILAGFHRSDLIILGARPSVGKSAAAMSIGYNIAKQGKPVVLFSLEMSREQLTDRLISIGSKVGLQQLRTGQFRSQLEIDMAIKAINEIKPVIDELPFIIDDTPSQTILEIKRACRRIKAENKDLSLVIIDYLQLIKSRKDDGNVNNQVAEISRGLKALAKELDVPVLALSQLSRNIEQRENSTPKLSDLRDSGAIEQDADIVIFINKNFGFGKEDGVSLMVAKHRNGPLGDADVKWDANTASFS